MSPSPSGKWQKRKRDPQIARKPKPVEDEDEEEEEEEIDEEDEPQSGPSDPAQVEAISEGGVRISDFPAVVRRTVNRHHSSVLAIVAVEQSLESGEAASHRGATSLENISYGQLQSRSAVPLECHCADVYVIMPPRITEGCGILKRFGNNWAHVLPMHADWFSPMAVHRLERQVVPHFFSGKSPDNTPEKYMECRNRIVAKYMENPEKKLSVTECHGVLIGIGVDDLTRIFRFLEHWGIINYCAVKPIHEPWNGGSYLSEDVNGEVRVPSTALKSIESLVQFDRPKCRLKASDVYPSMHRGDDLSGLDSKLRERLSEHCCNYCSRPIPVLYYQSQKEVDVLLCLNCFHEGRFVVGHSSIDFIKMDSTKDYGDDDGESWTDQETLLLLEAMEIYNDNWNEISEHVVTKSKAQCILHFVRLSIDDGLFKNIEVPGRSHLNTNENSAGPELQDPNFESGLPFPNSGNPVMSLVAFLATAVGPRVAAACAHASLAALSEGDSLPTEGAGIRSRMDSDSSKEVGSQGEFTNSNQLRGQNDGDVGLLSAEKVKTAAKAGLSAAALKAKLFADHEEREIQRLSANIINHQLKRLELKLKQFAEVETLLMKECEQVERARQRFGGERTRIISSQFGGASGIGSTLNLPGVSPTGNNNVTFNAIGNTRQQQQVLSPSSTSQPIISGFGNNNQQMHPHMSYMPPRQQMIGLGPRMPMSAISPSSSAQPNSLLSQMGNTQPNLSHPMMRPVSGTSSGFG